MTKKGLNGLIVSKNIFGKKRNYLNLIHELFSSNPVGDSLVISSISRLNDVLD